MAPERPGAGGPSTALVLLAGALALLLAGLAFLVGRETGRREALTTTPAVSEPAPAATPGEREPAPAAVAPADADADAPRWAEPDLVAEWQSLNPEGGASEAQREPQAAPEADAVRGYFAALDAIERDAKYWDDPKVLGMALMSQMQSGDSSGFDQLVASQREALSQLERLTVPPACAEHHRRTHALMGDAVRMLGQVRDAALAGDAGRLLGLPGEAQQLADQAREVDALGEQLRREHGLSD